MKVALVYDRINKWGGAERVLLTLHELFPEAPLYTAVADLKKAPWAKVFPKIYTSFLQNIPFFKSCHELVGWLTPLAFETFDFSGYDLVISVTSEAAKGIITHPPTKHVCYCLTPTRYLWSGREFYGRNPQKPLNLIPFYSLVSKPFLHYARLWDTIASARPDVMIAISQAVQKRIKKYYCRDSKVVFPPLNTNLFKTAEKNRSSNLTSKAKKDYFLVVSRLVPYKRVDLAVKAFNKLGYPLIIVGAGSQEAVLKHMAKSNIKFLGFVSDEKLASVYKNARALIYPQVEDFGLTSVEAQAMGAPVIAYNKGGALDTVIDKVTGVFFDKHTADSLVDAVKRFDRMEFTTLNLINNAERFSKEIFKKNFRKVLEEI